MGSSLKYQSRETQSVTMQNEAGEYVDMYIPRKCSASNRIIAAKDHASIQMNIVDVDETTGRMTSTFKTYAICGQIRRMGESDDCIIRQIIMLPLHGQNTAAVKLYITGQNSPYIVYKHKAMFLLNSWINYLPSSFNTYIYIIQLEKK